MGAPKEEIIEQATTKNEVSTSKLQNAADNKNSASNRQPANETKTKMAGKKPNEANNKRNIILVVAIFVIALAAWGATQLMPSGSGTHDYAVVHDGDGGATALSLDGNQEQSFTTSYGTNTVVISDGTVCVQSADCDNQDCVHQGAISSSGNQIICLPHKLWIEVVSANSADDAENGNTSMNTNKASLNDSDGSSSGSNASSGKTSDNSNSSFDTATR